MPSIECRTMPFEKALRIFRKKCDNAGIKDEVRKREFYEKPAAKRRRKLNSAKRRIERERQREQDAWTAYRRNFQRIR